MIIPLCLTAVSGTCTIQTLCVFYPPGCSSQANGVQLPTSHLEQPFLSGPQGGVVMLRVLRVECVVGTGDNAVGEVIQVCVRSHPARP